MRGTTESKWGKETDPQGRDLQALDRPDEFYAAGDYPTPAKPAKMPVLWHSFELRPFDFFDGNPVLDLPKR